THAVRALQKGAFDYITKPFKAKEIVFRINRYFESGVTFDNRQKIEAFTENQQQNHSAKQEKLSEQTIQQGEKKFIGNNPEINKLMGILPEIASTSAPIMIQGESGTGKEVFANLIYQNSKRFNAPYVKINCANLPRELVESTLFGHVKGA